MTTKIKLALSLTSYAWLASQSALSYPNQEKQAFTTTRELSQQLLQGEQRGDDQYSGEVLEIFESGGYSYVRFQAKDKEYWTASNYTSLSKGDKISLDGAYPMHDFYSKSLDRTFKLILFSNRIVKITK